LLEKSVPEEFPIFTQEMQMAIIRDAQGNVYNIPEQELSKYLVHVVAIQRDVAADGHAKELCLEPQLNGHDGWGYMHADAKPKK
jgi:hypothetical protein